MPAAVLYELQAENRYPSITRRGWTSSIANEQDTKTKCRASDVPQSLGHD